MEYLKQLPVGNRVLYTHKKYSISHNRPHVNHVNLTYADVLTSIASDKKVEFTYSITFEDRFDRYLENEFFEHRVRWFSIFNSFMMVIFLCGLVALILLRTLKNNYARFAEDDAEVLDAGQQLSVRVGVFHQVDVNVLAVFYRSRSTSTARRTPKCQSFLRES